MALQENKNGAIGDIIKSTLPNALDKLNAKIKIILKDLTSEGGKGVFVRNNVFYFLR